MDITTLAKLAKLSESAVDKLNATSSVIEGLSSSLGTVVQNSMAGAITSIDTAVVNLNASASGLGGIHQTMKEQIFTSNATWDWNAAGQPKCVWVTIYGSGGSGGNGQHAGAGGGGGSGYFVKDKYVAVTGNVSIVIGGDIEEHGNGQTSSFGGFISVNGGEGGYNTGYNYGNWSHRGWVGGRGGNNAGPGGGRHHYARGNNGNPNNGTGEGGGSAGPSGDHPSSHSGGGGGGGGGFNIGDGAGGEPGHGHSHHHRGAGGRGGTGYGGGGGGGAERQSGNGKRGICIVKYWVAT